MTKRHFEAMADIVKAILADEWTDDLPDWSAESHISVPTTYQQAARVAEAFIVLCERWNPRFDRQRFLVACGLVDAPSKVHKVRA